jgi:hypothetical protein
MNSVRLPPRIAHRLVWLLLAAAWFNPALGARLVDETFPLLQTKTGTYTNVTVTSHGDSYIFIKHANGLTSVKVTELPDEVRRQLGYPVVDPPNAGATNGLAAAARGMDGIANDTNALEAAWGSHRPALKFSSEILLTILAIGLLLHFFISYCFSLICQKANGTRSLLIWFPVLQLIPLFQAAGMSAWWLLGSCVPVLNVVAGVLWALNITKARGKSIWVAILLLLPITSFFAILYLAFSSCDVDEGPPKKFQAAALQTA